MFRPIPVAAALAALLALPAVHSADKAGGYSQPPKEILDVMRAPSPAQPLLSPTREHMLLVAMQDSPSIARVATPYLKLAGVRIEPKNHSQHDTPGGYGIRPCARSFDLVKVADGSSSAIKLPDNACPSVPMWSADGQRFAFQNTTTDTVELWVGEARSGKIRKIQGAWINSMFGDDMQWMPDQKTLLVKLVPAKLGAAPVKPDAPIGPSIQESSGGKGQFSTYEARDTLQTPHDEELFAYYGQSQLALVDADSGKITPLGKPDLYSDLEHAPDGRHLMVHTLRKPFSYAVTWGRFAHDVEVWDIAKRDKIQKHKIAALALADRVPVHGEPMGPRHFAWRPTEPASLVWAEALDGGDWNNKVEQRDKVMSWKAPFAGSPTEVLRTEMRFGGLSWGEKADTVLLAEYDINKHWMRSTRINFDQPQQAGKVLWDLSYDDRYANPGSPIFRRLPSGEAVLRQDGDAIFLTSQGASPDGNRPFLDRMDMSSGKKERLFRSGKTSYETFIGFADASSKRFLTWYQTPNDVPNAYVRTLGAPVEAAAGEAVYSSTRTMLTHIPDPAPLVRQIQKRLVKYKRADGVDLSFTLYTPPGYQEGTKVPTILYAYPLDYADPSKAGQISGSQYTFTRLRGYRHLLLAGYAIIDNAAFPVVGDPKKAYDTYTEQLVMDAKAAVDEAVRLGVADPERIGVTGHSHGALMTANLIAHTELFRAGVATSGSYNKTLTPFGFQSERRSVWEAPEVYRNVSTFFFADKIKQPLLIMHGADDANPGTTPLQATKLFEAVRGNGGVTRLVMLPNEPHWYTARESNEQEVYEMLTWFDKYVKNAKPREAATAK